MRTLTVTRWTGPPVTDRPSTRGRWIWTLTGLATVGLLAWPVVGLISRAGNGGQGEFVTAMPTMTRTVIVTQPVTSLSVESYGAPIRITAGPVHQVTVTEAISFAGPGQAPAVTAAVSDRRLTLDAPACATTGCSVGFTRGRAAGGGRHAPRAMTAASPWPAWPARTWTPAAGRCRPATSTDR